MNKTLAILGGIAIAVSGVGVADASGVIKITSTKQISPSVQRALRGHTGPRGAQGPQGATGAQGPAGSTGTQGPAGDPAAAGIDPSRIYRHAAAGRVAPGESVTVTADCNAGDFAVTGGYTTALVPGGTTPANVSPTADTAVSSDTAQLPTGWTDTLRSDQRVSIVTYVWCQRAPGSSAS